MNRIPAITDEPLYWTQPSKSSRVHVLRAADGTSCATLAVVTSFLQGLRTHAASTDGEWTFERTRSIPMRVGVRERESGVEVGAMHARWRGHKVELAQVGVLQWRMVSLLQGKCALVEPGGRRLVTIRPCEYYPPKLFWRRTVWGEMQIDAEGYGRNEVALIVLVAWYCRMLWREDMRYGVRFFWPWA